jgi:GAF domain-containing protein
LDNTYEYNSLLPETRSEIALPLRAEKNIIGVLDVQSDQSQAFTNDDVSIIQTLADQLAIAIERARLLQQVQQNLKELEQVYGHTTRDSWRSAAESGLIANFGYQFDNIRIQPINEAPALGQKAIQEKNKISEKDGTKQERVAIPIKLRGQPIGVVTVRLKEGYKQTTVNTIEQAVERLASSLESARLFEEARQRADREQTISHVTTAISSAPEFDAILRTAVEEIGKSLGDSEVSIRIIENTE